MRLEHRVLIGFSEKTDDRLRRLAQRLRARSRSGSAIVEFALIAPIFFFLMFSIIEVGVIYFAQSTLQFGTDDVARLVRTGQVQSTNMTQAAMRTRVCTDVAPLIPCDTNLQIDVESFPNFGTASYSPPLDANGNLSTGLNNYQVGTACDVVLIRVFYSWTVFTPLLTPFLSNMSGNKHLLYAAAAFRNEPFTNGLAGC